MSLPSRCLLGLLVLSLVSAAAAPARAQTACVTPNCVFGGSPADCQNRAVPRTRTVLMTESGLNFVYNPQNPKIEPGDCIVWQAVGFTHSAAGSLCPADSLCASPSPAACQFDSGNVDSLSDTPTATCAYDPANFPAGTGNNFYCRIHATPTIGTMRGTLRVTTLINLTVNKDLAANSVKLTWTGGGVTGDLSYKVERQSGGDPTFPMGSTTTVNPDSGVLGKTFTEAGDLTNPTTRYYLVRNKQTNEP